MATGASPHPAPRRVSVIIPVRNGAETIGEQLDALAVQRYAGEWEVLISDNGSTDGTRELAARWSGRLPNLTVVDASARAGSSFARNCGAAKATGDFLAFCDSDDVVDPDWLAALAAGACDYDAVTGKQDASVINSEIVQTWRPPRTNGMPRSTFLPFAPSCNLGVWADVFATTGGFDESYPQSHDVEWSWRVQLSSHTLGFAPGAVVHYRYRTSPRGIWKQAYLTGIDSVRLYRDYRAQGLTRVPVKKRLRTWAWLVYRLPYVAQPAKRGLWMRRAGEAGGRLAGSAQFRVWCI
ncbi:MAG TPA: glycosyltransferase family 2 protein [Acidimicrobiia bacterium]|jgi:glycosyltransferase involved in cell wall biosynthesis|nr:glycosyltransferase family 2 protein [Acidimicrobiia bacterium]